jgi:hypothetical protein
MESPKRFTNASSPVNFVMYVGSPFINHRIVVKN